MHSKRKWITFFFCPILYGIDLFSHFGWVLPGRGVDLCLSEKFLSFFFISCRCWFSDIYCKWVPYLGRDLPFTPKWIDNLSSLGLSISGVQHGCHEFFSKLVMFWKVDIFFSSFHNFLILIIFEQVSLNCFGKYGSDKGIFFGFGLIGEVRVKKADLSSVYVGSFHLYVSHMYENIYKISFRYPIITLDSQHASKPNSGHRRLKNVRTVRLTAKPTSIFYIKYLTIHWLPFKNGYNIWKDPVSCLKVFYWR